MPRDGSPQKHTAPVRLGSREFNIRFTRAGSLALGVLSLAVAVSGAATGRLLSIGSGAAGLLLFGSAYALTYRGDGMLGRRIFVYAPLFVACATGMLSEADGRRLASYVAISAVSVTLAAFVLTRVDLLIDVALALGMLGFLITRQILSEGWHPELSGTHVSAVGLIAVQALAVALFTANARKDQGKLQTYIAEIDQVMAHAARIAQGDLSGTEDGTSEVAATIRSMQGGLRDLVIQTREAASALSSSATEIEAMARQQEQGAVEQASAVTQVHRTLSTLIEGSSDAARSTEEVLRAAEATQKTSEVVAERAGALSLHTKRISALLETIRSIANKSEILALNASLEGARAGEAGRGFSLVASQMQRLAESVMGAVQDVRALVEDIDAATAATLSATEESTRLSARATNAARQISGTLQQQRRGAEQVSAAMVDIQQVTAQVSAGSAQSRSATRDLTRLAAELTRAIERFQLGRSDRDAAESETRSF